jgi:hypothetical protein
MKTKSRGLARTAVSLFLAFAAVDCGRRPDKEPLEVTYYYLPG